MHTNEGGSSKLEIVISLQWSERWEKSSQNKYTLPWFVTA